MSSTTATTTKPTTKPTTVGYEPEGSGCSPGAGKLPDGKWFGYLSDPTAGAADFDLACWFIGDAAVQAAKDDGAESPPPNDYYVRNASKEKRAVSIDSGASVVWFPDLGDPASEKTTTYAQWLTDAADRTSQPGAWITVKGGSVTKVEEQWTP